MEKLSEHKVAHFPLSCSVRRRAGHPTLNVPAHDMWQRHVTGTKSRNVHTEGTSSRDRFTICIYMKNEAEIAATSPPCEQVHDEFLFETFCLMTFSLLSFKAYIPCYPATCPLSVNITCHYPSYAFPEPPMQFLVRFLIRYKSALVRGGSVQLVPQAPPAERNRRLGLE